MPLSWLRGVINRAVDRLHRRRLERGVVPGRDGASRYERAHVVSVTGDGVFVTGPEFEPVSVTWTALRRVAIRTTDRGPLVPDVWWVLEATDGHICLFPNGATGEAEFVGALKARLADIDAPIAEAMKCTQNRRFVIWEQRDAKG